MECVSGYANAKLSFPCQSSALWAGDFDSAHQTNFTIVEKPKATRYELAVVEPKCFWKKSSLCDSKSSYLYGTARFMV